MVSTFVFDKNSLISAHLIPNSASRMAYDKAILLGVVVRPKEIYMEFLDVLYRKKFDKYLSLESKKSAVEAYKSISLLIPVTTRVNDCRDAKENKFLSLALDSRASCIITGDADLLILHPYKGISIFQASDFLNFF